MASDKLEYVLSLKDFMTDKIKGVQSSVGNLDSSMGNLEGTIKKVGAAIAAAFTINKIIDFGKSVIDAGSKVEDATTGLTTLLGDSAKAAQVVHNTMQDATKTPFAFEGLLSANQQIIASGVNAEKAREDVLNLANAVAASGKGNEEFERMAANLAQISTVGQATAMDIKQFGMAGINVYKVLADYTKQPISKVKEMSISYDMLTAALKKAHDEGGIYYNGLENMQKNTSVQISNLGDTIFSTMVDIYEKMKPLINFVLAGISQMLQGISDFVNNMDLSGIAEKMITVFQNIYNYLKPVFDALGRFFEGLFNIIGSVVERISDMTTETNGAAAGIRDAIVAIIDMFTRLLEPIGNFFSTMFDGIDRVWASLSQFSEQGGTLLDWIGDALIWCINLLSGFFDTMFTFIANVIDVAHTIYVVLEKLGIIWALKQAFINVWNVLSWIGNKLLWVYENVIKPVTDKIAQAYHYVKDLLGIKEVAITTTEKKAKEKEEKKMPEWLEDLKKMGDMKFTPASLPDIGSMRTSGGGKSDAAKVTGSKSTTINIQIGKLIEQFKIQTTNINEGAGQVKEKIAQALLSAINDSQIVAGI